MSRVIQTLILFLLSLSVSFAQKITVKSFTLDRSDATASVKRRMDGDDDPCALVKVQLARSGAAFQGDVVGQTIYSQSEYNVYMTKGAKRLDVRLDGYLPLMVRFADYGVTSLEPLVTYRLVLTLPNVGRQEVYHGTANSVTISSSNPFNGHAYVDLGLTDTQGRTVYWATCNIGADEPEDDGFYFAWGETEGYLTNTNQGDEFDWPDYRWCRGTENTITKYCVYSKAGIVDNKTVLELEDDAAHVHWGGGWRMPTRAELMQLCDKCKWKWDKKKRGYFVKGPNGNSIFMPATPHHSFTGGYYSSSLDTPGSLDAFYLYFDKKVVVGNRCGRCYVLSVRAVCQ